MIAKPMTQLLMKDAKFDFTDECKNAFNIIKEKLTIVPVIISPDWKENFELMCDASDFAVGAVLGQRVEGKFKPIYYASKTLNEAQEHYTTTEKELLAVVFAFDKFRSYLILSKTVVYTDHSALKYLFDKKGAENLVVDHQSRLENPELEVLNEKEIADDFPDEYLLMLRAEGNDEEPWYADFVNYIVGKVIPPNWNMEKRRSEKLRILEHCHSGPTGGHHSATITRRKVYDAGFFWPKIFKDAKDFVTRRDWSDKFNDALWALRTAFKTPTETTPFRLVYGKACHLPVEIEHKAYWALKQCDMDLDASTKHRLMELNELGELRDGAYENTRIYKEKTKKWHDSRLRGDKDFKIGEKVLLHTAYPGLRIRRIGALYRPSRIHMEFVEEFEKARNGRICWSLEVIRGHCPTHFLLANANGGSYRANLRGVF
ncbi:reverse transcriptase domain-containing protein [Tanacetum coccineum]